MRRKKNVARLLRFMRSIQKLLGFVTWYTSHYPVKSVCNGGAISSMRRNVAVQMPILLLQR
ncbi:MAG: hypothetical protein GAK38_04183 [Xylophilus sp.]|nr:MAG: hypothetical protein GAK38_04183 [Xylophilus sp.]